MAHVEHLPNGYEFTVTDIGSNTLQGCLVESNRTKMYPIKGKELVYNYDNLLVSADELVSDVHWLYEAGAKEVILRKWIPAHERQIDDRVYPVPRRRAYP